MNANARAALVALVCLLAIGLAAGTLPHPNPMTGGGSGSSGGFDGHGPGFLPGNATSASGPSPFARLLHAGVGLCFPVLATPAFIWAAILVGLLVLGLVYWRTNVYVAFVVLILGGIPAVLAHALLTSCTVDAADSGAAGRPPPNNSSLLAGGGGGGGGGLGTATAHVSPTSPLLLALALVVVGVAAAVLLRSTGDDEPPTPAGDPEAEGGADLDAVGRVAGDTADRIEAGTGVDNEVYRAWRDLTELLDVDDPETTTPAEFAVAARDAGMDDENVAALTDLFREVRYGGADPDADDRTARAVAALRAIEEANAAAEGESGRSDEEGDA